MTDFFDAVAGNASQSQIDRLRNQYAKEKRDGLLNLFATYQGIDPIDGTDRVAINGEINSGFKLICNAPLPIGGRVYLRKNNQGGLQRVDARNRPNPILSIPAIIDQTPFVISIGLQGVNFVFYGFNDGGSVSDLLFEIVHDSNGLIDKPNSSASFSDTKQLFPPPPIFPAPTEYEYLYGYLDFDIDSSILGLFGFENTNSDTGTINLSNSNSFFVRRVDDLPLFGNPYTKQFDVDIDIETYVSIDNGVSYTLDISDTYNFAIDTPTLTPPSISGTQVFSNIDYFGSQFKWYLRYRKSGNSDWYTL